jgi:hypothetical protein
LIGIYVIDCLVVGKEAHIEELVELQRSGFNLKVEKKLTDYWSCWGIEDICTQNLERKLPRKWCIKLLELQDSKLFARIMTPTSSTLIFKANTVLELACSFIGQTLWIRFI